MMQSKFLTNSIMSNLKRLSLGNEQYAVFNKRIVNTKMDLIGVRVPDLRRLAKDLASNITAADIDQLLATPSNLYEYVLLCGLFITQAKISDQEAIKLTRQYLQLVDSWAHIDTFVEKKRRFASVPWRNFALECFKSREEFVVRYGVVSLMTNFLDETNINQVFAVLQEIKHDGYYVKMALAWLYATAAVEFFDQTMAELANKQIDIWTRQKAYQKMRESRRFTPKQQEIIATFKRELAVGD